MRSSRITDVLRSIRELPEPIRVQGGSLSARALLIAQCVKEFTDRSTVIICQNDDTAAELASDIECLSTWVLGAPISVCHFPTWEQSLYNPISPSLRIRLARIAALSALAHQTAGIYITSIAGLSQATIPREVFLNYTLHLKVEESIESREALILRLVEAGYLRVDPVEDPGTFAVRGDIIDVFPPDRSNPIRIELFGDLVERMREFDPATQRATPVAPSTIRICPAREVLINSFTAPSIREKLKSTADEADVPRTVRDPILASVQAGTYPPYSETWAPFAYTSPATLWDYLSEVEASASEPIIIWNDELSCQQEWDQFIEDQKPDTEIIAPPPSSLFRWNSSLEFKVKSKTRLYLDQLDIADTTAILQSLEGEKEAAASSRHRMVVQVNRDMGQGSRHSLGELEPKFQLWKSQGFKVFILASTQSQLERIRFLMSNAQLESPQIALCVGSISEGFRWPAEGLVVLNESEILGSRHVRKQRRITVAESGSAAKEWSGLSALSDLSVGDAVVHVDHGIGRYQGLARLDLSGAPSDFLLLEYANKDRLYLPVYRLNVIQKYVGAGESVTLDRLGSQQFLKTKEKVRDAVKKLAVDLVQLYAERKIRPGIQFSPRDSSFREFEAKFPFDETPDQLKAIDAVLSDLESGRVMDRLVCGDVGYGKTEVAIRAAFRAVSDGKQVAVLVPTTVLAFQHEQSFKTRLKDYPISIDSISRFKTAKEQKGVLDSLASGKIDIIIGTHRLLSRDIKFRDLGLVIIDEEHRFGVEHKERLKTLKINTHVLTLTATPIPRTLHMALAGLRDISLINTPPIDRLPIRTYVSKYDEALIQRAIEFELNRGGQVFFLHNRVQTIYETATRIRELLKDSNVQVGVGHGQMGEGELEETMVAFYQKKINVLVCTTIIESGLDLPSANTIIIDRADMLGLAQLYQIRGRVGRGQHRAYAYLLIPSEGAMTDDAKRRLEVIQRFVELGSGFSVANHDLEIRGGGDLLGPQQSGHIAAVGFDLYTELLEEAIRELEGKPPSTEESRREPEIKAPFPAFLGEEYVPDVHQRLSLYRRFSGADKDSSVDRLEEELSDRFGPLPIEAQNLLWLIRLKIVLKQAGIDALTVGPEKISLVPGPGSQLDPVRAIALVSGARDTYQLTPDSKLVAKIPTTNLRDLYFALDTLIAKLRNP